MKTLNLLIYSSEFPPGPGGIGTHAYQIARQFANRGKFVTVLSPQDYVTPREIQKFNQAQPFPVLLVPHHPIIPLELGLQVNKLRHVIRTIQPNFILASGQHAVWAAAVCLKEMHIPWAAVGHGTEFGTNKVANQLLNRWAYKSANLVICVSQYTKAVLEQSGIRARRVVVIYNGADESRYCPDKLDGLAFRKRLGLENKFILLTVGNVTPRKGQEVVIRAMPEILKAIPNVHYLIAGLPTHKESLALLASQLGVAGCVHFLGRLEERELLQAYRACDLFVMTSRQTTDGDFEGYGIAVIEAALCGKPAVVSSGSGLEEAVIDQATGVVVNQNDPQSTASAIIRLWRSPAFIERMGINARVRALEEGTWSKVAEQYLGEFMTEGRNI